MPEEALPLWKYVVAGGLAGVTEISIMYPTDVLKTRAQLASTPLSMPQAFRNVISTQGVGGFYRGIVSPILAEAPKRAWKFSANEKFKQMFLAMNNNVPLTIPQFALSGTLAGISEAIINCPFETVKVRMQSPEFVKLFKSTSECLVYLVKNEGIGSVYKGLEAQMWRNGLWNGPYFGILGYIGIRNKSRPKSEVDAESKGKKLWEKFYVGAFASSVGTILNTPFDVVKSRMQAQSTAKVATVETVKKVVVNGKETTEKIEVKTPNPAAIKKYRHSLQSLGVIYREEGIRSLYKGLSARLIRLGPGGGIMIVAFEYISGLLKNF